VIPPESAEGDEKCTMVHRTVAMAMRNKAQHIENTSRGTDLPPRATRKERE
jgi:hypothetical protein